MSDLGSVKINGRVIRFRKWKVRDKKDLDKCQTEVEKRRVYVYNSLENPQEPLDLEEYNFVLANIRDYSLDDSFEYEVKCTHCGSTNNVSLRATDIVTFKDASYEPILVDDIVIELGPVRNQELYETVVIGAVTLSERYIADFAMHVTKINGNDVDYEDAIDYLENLDVSVYEKIFDQYETRKCRCSFTHNVRCNSCGKDDIYSFEDMKGFYPKTWNL